jgi:hypothetical protein
MNDENGVISGTYGGGGAKRCPERVLVRKRE